MLYLQSFTETFSISEFFQWGQPLANTLFISDANLVAYYKLDSNGNDSTANAYNLTNTNSVAFNPAKFGNGGDFGSSNTNKTLYINSNLGFAGSLTNRTISLWVNFYNLTGHQEFFSMWNGSDHEGNYLYSSGSDLLFAHGGWGVNENSYTATGALTTNTWYHVAYTYDGSTITAYLNGVLLGTAASTGSTGTTIGSVLTLGAAYGNGVATAYFSSVVLDDVAIFSRVLSSTEIRKIYLSTSITAYTKALSEAFSLAEAFVKSTTKTLVESFFLAELFARSLVRKLTDTFSISEALTKSKLKVRTLADSVSVLESFVMHLNGILQWFGKRIKGFQTWIARTKGAWTATGRTKPDNSFWTKRNKP